MKSKWTKWAFVGVVVLLVVAGNRGLWNLFQLAHEKRALSREVVRLQSDIAVLQAQYREYGSSPEAVERSAREDLDLIQPGEIIYKFTASNR
jgi:cell division protein FtsB